MHEYSAFMNFAKRRGTIRRRRALQVNECPDVFGVNIGKTQASLTSGMDSEPENPSPQSDLARRVLTNYSSTILSSDPFSALTANGRGLLPRWSLLCFRLRRRNAVHESPRLIREIDELSDHVR
jgi:hypothetical protein